jgi:alpha-glucoside transport system permease protein
MSSARTEAATAEAAAAVAVPVRRRRGRGTPPVLVAGAFLLPALVLLGALVIYPIIFTVIRSLYDRSGDVFVGLQNYQEMLTSGRTLTAIKNNVIWVAVAPTVVTVLGLIFAVLTERVRWGTAFKVAVFMPMAISFLAAGVIWRLVYEQDPQRGLANAAVQGVVHVFRSPGDYAGARPSEEQALQQQGQTMVTSGTFSPGDTVELGLVAIRPDRLPPDAGNAIQPQPVDEAITGVVWLDFTLGGGGEQGAVDSTERGLPGMAVEAVSGGRVAASTTTEANGTFVLEGLDQGDYSVRLPAPNFRAPWGGINWLGPTLITASVIVAYIWIYAGFAMVVIGAGLAAIPRDVLEAARVDGAGEWQVFRRVTVPLLAPVLGVVFVTLMISVLKVFDLVLVIPPGAVQDDANVIALEMWRAAFGARDWGLGSALAVFLLILVIPAMALNVRRFRAEG